MPVRDAVFPRAVREASSAAAGRRSSWALSWRSHPAAGRIPWLMLLSVCTRSCCSCRRPPTRAGAAAASHHYYLEMENLIHGVHVDTITRRSSCWWSPVRARRGRHSEQLPVPVPVQIRSRRSYCCPPARTRRSCMDASDAQRCQVTEESCCRWCRRRRPSDRNPKW